MNSLIATHLYTSVQHLKPHTCIVPLNTCYSRHTCLVLFNISFPSPICTPVKYHICLYTCEALLKSRILLNICSTSHLLSPTPVKLFSALAPLAGLINTCSSSYLWHFAQHLFSLTPGELGLTFVFQKPVNFTNLLSLTLVKLCSTHVLLHTSRALFSTCPP